mgnify:CR=1 FL=1
MKLYFHKFCNFTERLQLTSVTCILSKSRDHYANVIDHSLRVVNLNHSGFLTQLSVWQH